MGPVPVHTPNHNRDPVPTPPPPPVLSPATDRNENMETTAAQEKGVQSCWI